MSDPVPSGLACRRLAIAMAAGSGLRLDKMPPEDRAAFDKHANSALLYLGMRGELAAVHLAERMEGIAKALRNCATAMDDAEAGLFEHRIREAYVAASDAETVARILQGLPEPEPEESV